MLRSPLQPVLLGGLFTGVLSALPIISIANCCCVWVVGGGMVTAYLIQHGGSGPIQLSEGALGGFLSGVVGAVFYAALSVPIQLLMMPLQRDAVEGLLASAADVPPEVRELLETLGSSGSFVTLFIGFVVMLLVGMIFSTLGGLLGALIFRSSPPAEAPPLPPPGGPMLRS